ncbi:MFS transporter [Corynebacterium matruchotii]|uniref:MFS transporter n=1 Tax=Corynebacterium matruchotii TaxID=43768 RepID=UPI0028ECE364|nr:MFS transporter [Corynebacterium matruchotii]
MTIGPQKLGPYWLIGATTFSRIGTLAYTVVMTWAVSKAGGNNSVGWVNAAAGFTIVLVGISAVFWLDKFDKRTLLLLLDVSAAVVCLAAAAVLLLVPMSSVVFTGVVVAVVTSAVASLYSPASRALIPSMVPAEGLERYNSVYTGFSETSRAAGPGLGALLLAVGGIGSLSAEPHNKQHLFYHLLSPHTSTPAGPTTPGQETRTKGTRILPKRSRYHQTFDSAGRLPLR